ncbi:MAG: hypothetical protein AAGB05_06890 [Pseudomonadota bacterium]
MSAPFRLILDHDGISLAKPGQDAPLARVGLDDRNFDAGVAQMRQILADAGGHASKTAPNASTAAAGQYGVAVVLPDSQILYTETPASGLDDVADAARVRNALEGTTPYELEELRWDWALEGKTLRIAVVASETIAEAEAFVTGHGFVPLSYVGAPPAEGFPRPPRFTPAGPHDDVERDEAAEPALPDTYTDTPEAIEALSSVPEEQTELAERAADVAASAEAAEVEGLRLLARTTEEADAEETVFEDAALADAAPRTAAAPPDLPTATDATEPERDAAPVLGSFTSVRAALERARRANADKAEATGETQSDLEGTTAKAGLSRLRAEARSGSPSKPIVAQLPEERGAQETKVQIAATESASQERTLLQTIRATPDHETRAASVSDNGATSSPERGSAGDAPAADGKIPDVSLETGSDAGEAGSPKIGGATRSDGQASVKRREIRRRSVNAVVPAPVGVVPSKTTPMAEAESLTVFGARRQGVERRSGSRLLGLALTAALLAIMGFVALWSLWFGDVDQPTPLALIEPAGTETPGASVADASEAGLSVEDANGALEMATPRITPLPEDAPESVTGPDEQIADPAETVVAAPAQTTAAADPAPAAVATPEVSPSDAARPAPSPVAGSDVAQPNSTPPSVAPSRAAQADTSQSALVVDPLAPAVGTGPSSDETTSALADPVPAVPTGARTTTTAAAPSPSAGPAQRASVPQVAGTEVASSASPDVSAQVRLDLSGSAEAPRAADVPGLVTAALTPPGGAAPTPLRLPGRSLPDAQRRDARPAAPEPPLPRGSFLGSDGLVVPLEDGALAPGGYALFTGQPPILPPRRPDGTASTSEAADDPASRSIPDPLEGARPRARPADAPVDDSALSPPQDTAEAPEEGLVEEPTVTEALPEGEVGTPEEGIVTAAAPPQTDAPGTGPDPLLDSPADTLETNAPSVDPALAGAQPRGRPEGFADTIAERAAAAERADAIAQEQAEAAAAALAQAEAEAAERAAQIAADTASATRLAVPAAPLPPARPRTMAQIVARAEAPRPSPSAVAPPTEAEETADAPRAPAAAQAAAASAVAAPAPNAPVIRRSDRVRPSEPSSALVARQATQTNALRLNRVTLIGVYGSASQRRALVRLPSGRYVKVQVGDRLDGGRVTSMTRDSLQYTKSGRAVELEMPSG